jgi:hypothetical protein
MQARLFRNVVIVGCFAVSLAACEAERAPAGITCKQLRALQVGMSSDEVRALLGPPINDHRQDGRTVFGGPRGTDMQWDWSEPGSNGVRLNLYFRDDHLTGADSWIRTMWRDIFDNESRPELFSLTAAGLKEGADFKRIYCP